jgi:hypothetical protein
LFGVGLAFLIRTLDLGPDVRAKQIICLSIPGYEQFPMPLGFFPPPALNLFSLRLGGF